MTNIRRVLLVGPQDGARWRSISAYTGSLREMLTLAGVEVEAAVAPWFNPPSLLEGVRARWTRQENLQRAEEGAFDLVHLTDHALAHHIPRFQHQCPVVVTCHDVMPLSVHGYYRSRREAVLKRAFLRRPYRTLHRADGVISVSDYTTREARRRLAVDERRISVVPNVIRPAFRQMTRLEAEMLLAAAGIKLPPSPRVISLGHRQGYKNLRPLIEAMARPSLAHASLVRVGPPLDGTLLSLAESIGVRRRLVELGTITDDLLAAVYAAGDVLAQPSLAEGFGLPVIEAMACGLPVTVSDGGALPAVVADAGVVVPLGVGFAARFASGLRSALEERERLIPLGTARVRAFRPMAVLPSLLTAYESAVGHRSAAEA